MPHGVGMPIEPGRMLAAVSRPIRMQWRVSQAAVRVDEIAPSKSHEKIIDSH